MLLPNAFLSSETHLRNINNNKKTHFWPKITHENRMTIIRAGIIVIQSRDSCILGLQKNENKEWLSPRLLSLKDRFGFRNYIYLVKYTSYLSYGQEYWGWSEVSLIGVMRCLRANLENLEDQSIVRLVQGKVSFDSSSNGWVTNVKILVFISNSRVTLLLIPHKFRSLMGGSFVRSGIRKMYPSL